MEEIWYRVYAGSIEEVTVVHETPRCVRLKGSKYAIPKQINIGPLKIPRIYTKDLRLAQDMCYTYLSQQAMDAAKAFMLWNRRLKELKNKYKLDGSLYDFK